MRPDITEAFQLNISVLKITGLWCYRTEAIYRIYKFAVTTILLLNYVSMIICALSHHEDIFGVILFLPSYTKCLLKCVIFRKNFKRVDELLELTRTQLDLLDQSDILQESIRFSQFALKSSFCLVLGTGISLSVGPLLQDKTELPVIVALPFDYHAPILFEGVYVCVCLLFFYYAYINMATDTFFYICAIQIGAQCDILGGNLQNLGMRNRMVWCVCYYQKILHYSQILTECYDDMMMAQFVCSAASLCLIMYQLSIATFGVGLFKLCFFWSAVTYEIFMYCYFGNLILTKSEQLTERLYESNWYTESKIFQKDLHIFRGQLLKPISIYVWDIFPLNFQTFKEANSFVTCSSAA